jgi:subtilase family serine protease
MSWIRTDAGLSPAFTPAGYGPSDLLSAYNLTAASASNGAAQTIAIVDAFDDPNAEADLAVYRSTFGLTPCTTANGCFMKVNQSGTTGSYPSPDAGWAGEISLDLDMASAICPKCEIVLVEANTNSNFDLFTAVQTAATTCAANVVSNSWSEGEYNGETSDSATYFKISGVMLTFASGDSGWPGGYPAASQYVTAVGGTTLTHSGTWSETVWTGTGSICSAFEPQPAWQTALGSTVTSACSMRIDNDVAAVADPNTGVAVYDTYMQGGWVVYGGTSVATPIIAGVYALAGNEASITYGSYSYGHLASMNDIISGSNGTCGSLVCNAGAGFDGPTGNGTPNGIGGF